MNELGDDPLWKIFQHLPLVDLVAGVSQVSRAWHHTLCKKGHEILGTDVTLGSISWPRAMALGLAAVVLPLERLTFSVDPDTLAAAVNDPLKMLAFELPPCDASAADLFAILEHVLEVRSSKTLPQLVLRAIAEGDYGTFLRIGFFLADGPPGVRIRRVPLNRKKDAVLSLCEGPDGVAWHHWAMFFGQPGFFDLSHAPPYKPWSVPLLMCTDMEMFLAYVRTVVKYAQENVSYFWDAKVWVPFRAALEPPAVHAALDRGLPLPALYVCIGEVADLLATAQDCIAVWPYLKIELNVVTSIVERRLLTLFGAVDA